MKPALYQREAQNTKSPDYHTDKVDPLALISLMHLVSTQIIPDFDAVKKSLFYGKELPGRQDDLLVQALTRYKKILPYANPNNAHDMAATIPPDVIHAVLGIFTEAGELFENMTTAVEKQEFPDEVNLREEAGDLLWYLALLFDALGTTFEAEMARNNAKLRARFPDRFTQHDAEHRDLIAEREVLQNG
jgi:NTP pyrophosphatase (non-canonical NTP hydrolase)